jgi:hypothetical protein
MKFKVLRSTRYQTNSFAGYLKFRMMLDRRGFNQSEVSSQHYFLWNKEEDAALLAHIWSGEANFFRPIRKHRMV